MNYFCTLNGQAEGRQLSSELSLYSKNSLRSAYVHAYIPEATSVRGRS